MKYVMLDAVRVRRLIKQGRITVTGKLQTVGSPEAGDVAAIKEPWAELLPPAGTDMYGEARIILETDATARPLNFTYRPAVTMPLSAVKRYVRWETVSPGTVRLTLDQEHTMTPSERELERVKAARIRRYGGDNQEQWPDSKRALRNDNMC